VSARNIAGRLEGQKKAGKQKYDVFRTSWGEKRLVSGPHAWPVAWREAAKLNKQAREDFKEGRIMYDVPEYVIEARSGR